MSVSRRCVTTMASAVPARTMSAAFGASREPAAARPPPAGRRRPPRPPRRARARAATPPRRRQPRPLSPTTSGPDGSRRTSWRMKEMTPSAVRERLVVQSALIVPVGTTEQHGPHLPLGCDTIIVERLADDLSPYRGTPGADRRVWRTHTHPVVSRRGRLRRKTLHRTMNELIASWEEGAGVRQFLILTAQNNDAHQEALSTIRAEEASVLAVDVFAMDFSTVIQRPGGPVHGGELEHADALHRTRPGPYGAGTGLSAASRPRGPALRPSARAGTAHRLPRFSGVPSFSPPPRRVSGYIP